MPTNDSVNQSATIEFRLARMTAIAWVAPFIGLICTLWLMDVSFYLIGLISFLLGGLGLYCILTVWQKSQYQFRNLHNLLDAMGHGDYSLRGVVDNNKSAYSNLVDSINTLADTLHKQRLKTEEGHYLLEKIVNQFDGAIIAWDKNDRVLILNAAAVRFLGISDEGKKSVTDRNIVLPDQLAMAKAMTAGETLVVENPFGSSHGKYRLHLEQFIADGDTQNLLFVTNVSNMLREEEKKAWKNLVRVLSHEINNSLAPLISLSNSLQRQVQKREKDPILESELREGLAIVENRSRSLENFVRNYQNITKLPAPERSVVQFLQLMASLIRLFPEETIETVGDAVDLFADPAQLEQMLINLIKNAADANRANVHLAKDDRHIDIRWTKRDSKLIVTVKDVGQGIQNPDNIFTPFYTTKEEGSGIGLVLCQQIIEGHDGYLSIDDRADRPGCVVTIELPLHPL
ncbi:MAG: ATP-binding protein [Cellvibrionaceae bacterium]